jgi:hypothetical protein
MDYFGMVDMKCALGFATMDGLGFAKPQPNLQDEIALGFAKPQPNLQA